jgi:hypothetical protein
MGKSFYDKKKDLATSIQKYRFAATIEITNALCNSAEKSDQAKLAKRYLEQLSEGCAEVMAGIAYNGNWVNPDEIRGLDFLIDVQNYNPERLENVTGEMLASDYLTKKDKVLLEKILANRNPEFPLPYFFSCSSIGPCAEYLGVEMHEYRRRLSDLKGLCMELYIKSVFDDELDNKIIHHRHNFGYKPEPHAKSEYSDADNIVVCNVADFYGALKRIEKNNEFTAWVIKT